MAYAAKNKVATVNGLGGDTIKGNRTHVRTDRWTDDGPTLVQNKYAIFF